MKASSTTIVTDIKKTSRETCLTTVEVKEPRSQEQDDQVTSNERSENAQISPPVVEFISERLVELVTNLVCAVFAYVGSVVKNVPRCAAAEEILHVGAAVFTIGCAELVEFARCAFDFAVVEFRDDHAADEACEGVELVEPDTPELGDQGLGDGDTTEQGEDDDDL